MPKLGYWLNRSTKLIVGDLTFDGRVKKHDAPQRISTMPDGMNTYLYYFETKEGLVIPISKGRNPGLNMKDSIHVEAVELGSTASGIHERILKLDDRHPFFK